jgi:hypothetical protein
LILVPDSLFCNIQILDPRFYLSWDDLVLASHNYSFFHSSAWARVLSESYRYTPLYFAALEDGKLRALVPLMEVNSILTGKRGVSLPFTDYCEPIIEKASDFFGLFNSIVEYGEKRGWKYLELRGGDIYFRSQESGVRSQETKEPATTDGQPGMSNESFGSLPESRNLIPDAILPARPSQTYLGHTLDLTKGENALQAALRDSTRRNIKKARMQGVAATISSDSEAVRDFCRLNSMTRREHGLPPQPYYFFQKVYDHIISKGYGFVSLASRNGRNIAGAIFFHFGDQGIYKYGASDKKYQDLRANNLVMWEGINWFREHGYKSFCFGRTERESSGLRQFKRGWGAEEKILKYFRYDLKRREFMANQSRISTFKTRLFKSVPIPIMNLAGSLLYRHMG